MVKKKIKQKVKRKFKIDLQDEDRRSRYLYELDNSPIRTEILTLLADSDHVKVYRDHVSGKFVVKSHHLWDETREPIKGSLAPKFHPVQERSYWYEDVLDALIYACLMTTFESLDDFIYAAGTKDLEQFVC